MTAAASQVVQFATAGTGLAVVAGRWVLARRGRDPLGPQPHGALPRTGDALLLGLAAWFLVQFALVAVAPAAGLDRGALFTAVAIAHAVIAVVMLPFVLRGAVRPVLPGPRLAAAGILGGLATYGVVGVVGLLLEQAYVAAGTAIPKQEVVSSAQQASGFAWAGALVAAGVLAPFSEEVLFRGALLPALAQVMPARNAVVLQAAAFGLVHALGWPPVMWPLVLPLALIGLICGWLYVRTGSLATAMLVHAAFNGLNLVFLRIGGG